MDRSNGMKRSSSENATNATRDPETMSANPTDLTVTKPWKQRFIFRQPRKQHTLEEVCRVPLDMVYRDKWSVPLTIEKVQDTDYPYQT